MWRAIDAHFLAQRELRTRPISLHCAFMHAKKKRPVTERFFAVSLTKMNAGKA